MSVTGKIKKTVFYISGSLTKSSSQQGQALGKRRFVVFVSFEFERDVALVIVPSHNTGDARVVQVEPVPQAAAIVCLGVHEDRF